MIRFFTNRELAAKLCINLARWKRWSREFLPPDPLGGLQSGYARQYPPNDAVTVYLGGHLVAKLDYSIPEARQILSDLQPWLLARGLLDDYGAGSAAPIPPLRSSGDVHIRIHPFPASTRGPIAFEYQIRERVSVRTTAGDGAGVCEERYVETYLGERAPVKVEKEALSWRTLNISRLCRRFHERLGRRGPDLTHRSSR